MIDPELDHIIRALIGEQTPGIATAVIRDGVVIHAGGYGYANLEWSIPIGTDTVFRLASITKQFTATAIMLLVNAGELALDDPLITFLPEYPAAGHAVRVHHLLTHTSGIKSYTSMEGFFEKMSRHDMSLDELTAYFQNEPFDFAPGAKFSYNNSGYVLLGRIIEHVSGLSYAEFIQQRIFAPLGMCDSYYLSNEPVIPRRASGYERVGDTYHNAAFLSMALPHAAGSLGSTIDDLIRWDTALREHQLLDRATLERMYTPVTLNDGTTENYGFGWSIGNYYGHPLVHHSGGINGFRTHIARFPDSAVTVIVLGNAGDIDAELLARRISKWILEIPAVQRDFVQLDEQTIMQTTGTYTAENGQCEVKWENEQLKLTGPSNYTLRATSPATFIAQQDDDVEVRFDAEEDGKFKTITIVLPFFTWTGTRATPT